MLLLLAVFAWLPVDWLREHWFSRGIAQTAQPSTALELEGIALLDIASDEPSTEQRSRELPAELPSSEVEIETNEAPPTQLEGWDWSYDPLVPLRAGAAEPALRGARLPDESLRESLSWREFSAYASRDTTQRRRRNFQALQRAMLLTQLPTWDLEARALWLEQEELWLKLYGDIDEWP